MAVSTGWYQQWHPPSNIYYDNNINHESTSTNSESSHRYNYGSTSTNLSSALPFLFSLGLLSSRESKLEPFKPLETTGPFKTWYYWKELDFAFDSPIDREIAIQNEEYIPENNLPLGVAVHKNRIFVSMPKWKSGVPATLAVLPLIPKEPSPLMVPYPNWQWHTSGSCYGLTSVFRMQVDICDRLWVLDSGQIDVTIKPKQICPPQVLIFDLNTDELIHQYILPDEYIKQDSLYSNIEVDIRNGDCENAHAYLADVWRFGLVVYSFRRNRSWRITDHLFYPEPLAAAYNVLGLEFEWTDGIFGFALSPFDRKTEDRFLYFHPMSSFRQFYTQTSIICNETGWQNYKNAFRVIGESRGKSGHTSASGMDRNGILFYNLVTRSSVGCWDSSKPYKRENLGFVAHSNTTLIFPNDLKIDHEERQSIWVLTNRLPFYLYKKLNKDDINFRIMSAYVDDAIEGTVCDPRLSYSDSYFDAEEDCY